MKKTKIMILITLLILLCIIPIFVFYNGNSELRTIKSERELLRIYEGDKNISKNDKLLNIATLPFSILYNAYNSRIYTVDYGIGINRDVKSSSGNLVPENMMVDSNTSSQSVKGAKSSSAKDYSTTNIQVENVDEADITKTDGDYIYSISENNVIITNILEPDNIKIEATIKSNDESIPEDLILYKNQLVVISTSYTNSRSYYYYNNNSNTIVKIYDITKKDNPKLVKNYELCEPYYTSRCIDNKLYVISSGNLQKEEDKIITYYNEDGKEKEIGLDNIKYLKDVKTKKQTLISVVDLNDTKADINVSSYLIDISNAYVSENSIYLLNQKYHYNNAIPVSSIFGVKGILGAFDNSIYDNSYGQYTEIYKFDILKDGQVKYNTKTKIKGKTINQYSLDEYNRHLRVALYDGDGARVAIFDENLNQIGISKYVAKGETMYSSRFMNNKVYLVTYRTTDPLFVIDLSNEKEPKVLGELKIPGYSTYLHPYDENHLIGIGMETEEKVNRNSSGKVVSTTSTITGMKMALFDVSDVNNPTQISSTVIGDRRTTSAILTNPKALLFSKERGLIAIPVNNYSEDFEINNSSDSYSSIVNSYTNYRKTYVAEGYFVYNIDIENGFNLKGIITHDKNDSKNSSYYYYYNNSKLLRGLYVDNNLYTVSETAVKVNNLDTLELISELKLK